MTHPDCENPTRQGDCLTRWARVLCDSCDSLLSHDERIEREAVLKFKTMRRRARAQFAKLQPAQCLTLWKSGSDSRTCIQKKLVNPCCWCVSQLSDKKLRAWALKNAKRDSDLEQDWSQQRISDHYAEELKSASVTGCHWNIEHAFFGGEADQDRTALVFFLFAFGKPCWVHDSVGWLKHEYVKRPRKHKKPCLGSAAA